MFLLIGFIMFLLFCFKANIYTNVLPYFPEPILQKTLENHCFATKINPC